MKTNMTFSLNLSREKEVKEALDSQIKAALVACGEIAHTHAVDLCPIDTGRLINSIHYTVYKSQGGTYRYKDRGLKNGKKTPEGPKQYEYSYGAVGDEKSMYLGTNVEYAPYVEEGSKGRTPKHFIKYAIENHKEEYRQEIHRHLSGEAR